MIYKVEVHHQTPHYRNGKKEAEVVLYEATNFRNKEMALDFIEINLKQKEAQGATIRRNKKEGKFYAYMGNTWINESTGDRYEETFIYELKRAI